MYHIAFAYTLTEMLCKPRQRFCGVSVACLYLNGTDLVFQLAVVGNEEVYFNVVAVLLLIISCVEIKLMTIRHQHLRDGILIEHSLIYRHLAEQQLAIKRSEEHTPELQSPQ